MMYDITPGSELTRTVKETAKAGSSVGNAVVATDADNDPLLYSAGPGVAIDVVGNPPSLLTLTIHYQQLICRCCRPVHD